MTKYMANSSYVAKNLKLYEYRIQGQARHVPSKYGLQDSHWRNRNIFDGGTEGDATDFGKSRRQRSQYEVWPPTLTGDDLAATARVVQGAAAPNFAIFL
jgi:hypothetical protein